MPPASPLIVAFSCGTDSLALLLAAVQLRASEGLNLHACHIDHGLDSESELRAKRAEEMAASVGLKPGDRFHCVRLSSKPNRGESLEAWAREQRYGVLASLAESLGEAWVATAHHADDQAETLLLRLLFGTGVAGMGGIRSRRDTVIRPFLGLSRADLVRFVSAEERAPAHDPTNDDVSFPRNRIRRCILPEWKRRDPKLVSQLGKVAVAAHRATRRIEGWLVRKAEIQPLSGRKGAGLHRPVLVGLPPELRCHALSALDRAAGRQYPTQKRARMELFRQLETCRGKVACDAGAGWRWYGDSLTLRLLAPSTQPLANFTYTLRGPGSVDLLEVGVRASIRRGGFEPWMLEAHSDRAGFVLGRAELDSAFDGASDHCFEIRNRRSGDRIQPFGACRPKKLKDLLIDKRIPREQRDRLPIVVSKGRLIWVPGVALEERHRLQPETTNVWVVELHRLDQNPGIQNDLPSDES